MKKYLLIGLFMPIITGRAAIISWDGEGGDGLWTNAANWSGDIIPAAGDDVFLDNSAISVSYTVTLPPGNTGVSIRTLLINPGGSLTITLILPSTNTADPGLLVSGPADALVLNAGAVLKNASGASTGPGLSILNTFRINNGARYIHNTGRSNAAIVNQLSTAVGTETGIFEYDVPVAGYTISLTGRTYGSLVLSAATRGNNVSYTGNGSTPVRIKGDFIINPQAALNSGVSADLIVQRNTEIATGAVFNCQNGVNNNVVRMGGDLLIKGTITKTGTGLPVIELNGLNNQHINVTGSIDGTISLRVNNGAGITLDAPLRLPYHLQLTNGKVITSASNMLTLIDNAVCSGASASSFIEGPLRKEGDDDFTFPVGKGQIYAPVRLAPGSGASSTDQFTAEYIRSNPQSRFGINYQPAGNIDHISYVEYWDITSNTGTAVSKLITLAVTCESFCKTAADLFIAAYDPGGTQWLNKGQASASLTSPVTCPVNLAGTITAGPVNSFSHFTIASSQPFPINPLPVQLISFHVVSEGGKNMLGWEMGETPEGVRFEIERAGEDKRFYVIGRIDGNTSEHRYSFIDAFFTGSLYYYRLKWKTTGGLSAYSKVVAINYNKASFLSLFPSLVSSSASISIVSSHEQALELVVLDMSGQVKMKQHHQLPAGNTDLTLSLAHLPKGVYQLVGSTVDGMKEVRRFIKL